MNNRQWAVWTSDGDNSIHEGPSLARIAKEIERTGLNILAAVEMSALVTPDKSGVPIRVTVASNRGSS